MLSRRPRIALLIGAAMLPYAAAAQTVDYSALEATIGEPITTSVTGKPQRASELPASAVIITAKQIAASSARDVPGLLKSQAGVDVNRWTAGHTDVAVRGGVQTYNARLLVLVDGRQVYLDHYGMTDWSLLGVQLEEIQQIELVRGPASALFGFNAASGVVNIVTKRAGAAPAVQATGSVGNRGQSRVASTVSVPLTAQIGSRITVGRHRENERRVPVDQLAPTPMFDVATDQVSGVVSGQFARTVASIGGGHSTNRQVEYLPSQLLSNQRYASSNAHVTLEQDTAWGGVSLNGYVNWLSADYGIQALDGRTFPSARLNNRIAVLKASGLYRLSPSDTVRFGVEARNNRLRSASQFARDISYDVFSADMMVDSHPTDRVSLTGAVRADRLWLHQDGAVRQPAFDDPEAFDRALTRVSFNAAAAVRIGETGRLRLNGGLGYQLPSLVNYGLRLPIQTLFPVPIFIAGTPTIRPVRVWSGELGYTEAVGAVTLEVTGFYNRTEDAIASPGDGLQPNLELFLTPAPVLVTRFRSVGHYASWGAELSAAGPAGPLYWRANYTWTQTDGDLTGTALPIAYALSPRSTTPRHKGNLELGYEGERWSVSALGRYTSATRQFAFTRTPQLRLFQVEDAMALDAQVAFAVSSQLRLFVAGENLTLASGAAGSPIPADRRVRGGVRLKI